MVATDATSAAALTGSDRPHAPVHDRAFGANGETQPPPAPRVIEASTARHMPDVASEPDDLPHSAAGLGASPIDDAQIEVARAFFEKRPPHEKGNEFFLKRDDGKPVTVANAEQARDLIRRAGVEYLNLRAEDDIVTVATDQDDLGYRYYRFQQTYKDIPIHATELVARADASDNFDLLTGRFEPGLEVDVNARMDGVDAIVTALSQMHFPPIGAPQFVAAPSLSIHYDDSNANAVLTYRASVEYMGVDNMSHAQEILADANTGALVLFKEQAHSGRTVNSVRYAAVPVMPRAVLPRAPIVPVRPPVLVPYLPPMMAPAPAPVLLPPIGPFPMPMPPMGPIPVLLPPIGPMPFPMPPIATLPPLFPPVNTTPFPPINMPVPTQPTTTPSAPSSTGTLDRKMYQLSAQNSCTGDPQRPDPLPGTLVKGESTSNGQPSSEMTAAFEALGNTYWYYKHMHGRNAWDDKGLSIFSSMNAQFYIPSQQNGYAGQCTPNNAQYRDDKKQLVFGAGLTPALDLVAHEYTHGVTMHTSKLGDEGYTATGQMLNPEGGSMNEASSDVFGAGVEAWVRSGGSKSGNPATITPDANTWKLCEACGSNFPPRFLGDPKQGESSLHKSSYHYSKVNWSDAQQAKNAHGNGGIYTMAFYLLSQGGTNPVDTKHVNVSGISITKALKVFYSGNLMLNPKSRYKDARVKLAEAARTLRTAELSSTATSTERCSFWNSVNQAFDAVGVPASSETCN